MPILSKPMTLACSCALLLGCGQGVSTSIETVGSHTIEIVETAKGGGESATQVKPDGSMVLIHTSSSGTIRLEDEILTVNDVKYTIPNVTDSIRIEYGKVHINNSPVSPDEK